MSLTWVIGRLNYAEVTSAILDSYGQLSIYGEWVPTTSEKVEIKFKINVVHDANFNSDQLENDDTVYLQS